MTQTTHPLELYNGLYYNKDDGPPTNPNAFRVAPYGANDKELKLTRQGGGLGSEVKLEKKGHDKFTSSDGATTYDFKRNSSGAVIHVKETPVGLGISFQYDKVAGSEKPGGAAGATGAAGASAPETKQKGADGKDVPAAGPKALDAKELRELALKKQRDDDVSARKLYAPLSTLPLLFNTLLSHARDFTAAAAQSGAEAGSARTAASAAEKELLTKIAAHSPEVLVAAWTLIASSASDDTLQSLALSFVRHIQLGATMLTGLWTALRETARFASLRTLCPVVVDPLIAATSDWELDPPVPRAAAPPSPDTKAVAAAAAAAPGAVVGDAKAAAEAKAAAQALADAKALADAMAASQPPPTGYHRSPLSGLIMSPPVLALECVLLGYQHAPDLFLPALPALMALVDVSGDHTRDRVALVHLIRCAMYVFSGYDAVYDVVRPVLNEHVPAQPPRTLIQSTLNAAQWLVPTPSSALSTPLPAPAAAAAAPVSPAAAAPAAATGTTPAAAAPGAAAAAAAAANKPVDGKTAAAATADGKAEAKAEQAGGAATAAATAAAPVLSAANVAAISALADPNLSTTSASGSGGWVEGEYTSKAAGGAMRWSLAANVSGMQVRGSWRRVHGKTRPGQGMIVSPALGGSGVRDLDPITHTTQLAGFKKGGNVLTLAGDGNTAQYFQAQIQDARQDEFQVKILTKEPRWVTTDQLLYDVQLPSIESIVDALNKPGTPDRLFVLAKRGITDQHYVRGLIVKAELPRSIQIKAGEAPYQLREQLTVRFSSDRKEEVISRDRIRVYKPCYTRVRGELDAGTVSGVLHRTSNGKAVVLGTRRTLTNGAPSTFEAQLSEYEGKIAAAAPGSSVFEEGMTARWAHGDEEYATEVAVRARVAPDNRAVLDSTALAAAAAAGTAAIRPAQIVRFGDGAYVHCGADTALAFHEQQPFTVEAIVRLQRRGDETDYGLDKKAAADAAGSVYTIVSKYNKGFGPADWKLSLNEKRQVVWLGAPATDVVLEYERWYHVAGVYDGSKAYVYVDGVSVREAELKAADAVTPANAYAPVTIGGAQNSGLKSGHQDAFPGHVCEVRVWGEARSATLIAACARRRLTGSESGLLGYWPLTSVFALCDDASLLQHHGVLTSAADSKARQWDDVVVGVGDAQQQQQPLQRPVADHFHTRVNDFLLAGDIDARTIAANGGLVLPLANTAAAGAAAVVTGAALWNGVGASDGAAVWSRHKFSLLTGFRSTLDFRTRTAAEVTSVALHLNLRALPSIVPVPPRPAPPKQPSAHAATPAFVTTPAPFSPYFASCPTAPLIASLSVAVTVRALELGSADVPAGVEVERVTVQVYTTSSLGVFQTLAASTHDILVTAAARAAPTTPIVVDYEVGVHQLTVSRAGRVLLTHKQNLLAVLMAEKHDASVYAGVSSGAVAHLAGDGPADAKLPAVLPKVTPLVKWTMEGGKNFGSADKALAHPDDEKVWLQHTMTQLKELEKWMRGSVHANSWKCARLDWLDSVNAVTNVKDAVNVLLTLFGNILWSNKWEKPDRDKWEKEFTTTCTTLADFAKALTFFEDHLPLDAMFGPWKGALNNIPDNRGLLLHALNTIKDTDLHRRRVVDSAKKLRAAVTALGLFDDKEKKVAADEKAAKDGKHVAPPADAKQVVPGTPAQAPQAPAAAAVDVVTGEQADAGFADAERLAVCTYALRRCDDDLSRAQAWLVDKQPSVRAYLVHRVFEHASRRHWLGAAHSIDNNTLVDDAHPGPALDVSGDWDGTRGYLQLVNEAAFVGKMATCAFPAGDGRCRGFLSRNVAGGWRFDGLLTQSLYRYPAVAQFEFSEGAGKMHGMVFYGGSVGTEWNADKVSDYPQRGKEGFAGLVNLGNTCYQNSFLQSLFMTKQLRQSLLSIPLTAYPSATKAERDAKLKAAAELKAAEAKAKGIDEKKASVVAAQKKADGDEVLTDPKLVLQRLQSVFAALQLSQRSTVNQLPLKSLVKKPYCGDKQDDSREYGSYLLSQFEEALKGTPHADLAKSVFGGKIRNVSRCQECGATRAREDTINELAVSFPKLYAPITHMTVIVSKDTAVAAPEGFEKIPIDMNSGRPRATNPHMYFCVKREPGAPPITELFFWYADEKTEIKGNEGQEILPYNLNDGGVDKGANIRLSYRRSHTTGNPVTQITFLDSEKAQPPAGFVKLEFDISKGQANKPLYMCYKRGLPLRDIKLTTAPSRQEAIALLPDGYDTFATDLNVKPHEGHRMKVWIGFRSGGTGLPITDLSVRLSPSGPPSTHPPLPKNVTAEGYMIGAQSLDLLITRGHGTPIVGMEVFRAPQQFKPFSDMEKLDLAPHLAAANSDEKIDPYTGLTNAPWPMDSGDTIVWDTRQDRSAPSQFDCHLIEGKYETNDGKIEAILFPRLERNPIPGMPSEWKWVMQGVWKQHNYKVRQPFELVFSDDNFTTFRGTYMYGTGEGDWNGNRKSGPVDDKKDDKKGGSATSVESNATAPIIGVCVIPKGANPPAGYVKVAKTPAGNDAQLDAAGHYLCLLRGPEPKEEPKKADAASAAPAAKPADGKDGKDGKKSDDDALAQALALSAAEVATTTAPAPAKPADPAAGAPKPNADAPKDVAAAATPAPAATTTTPAGPDAITDILVLAAELDTVPDGYEPVKVVSGKGTDVRYECKGGDVPLLLYVSRKPAAANPAGDEKKVLWDLQLVWGTEKVPAGFTKIADTPVSMPADLASNGTFGGGRAHQLFVSVHKSVPKSKEQIAAEKAAQDKPAPHPVEGVYASNFGNTTLKLVGGRTPLKGWGQSGKYKGGGGQVQGVMFNTKPPGQAGGHLRFMGTYAKTAQKYPGVCIWDFDTKLSEVKGNGSFNETQFTWNGCKDSYVHLGLSRNYRSYWQHGLEQFGSTATAADLKAAGVTDKQLAAMPPTGAGNHISSMVQAYFNPEVLDRANWLQCDSAQCKKKPTPHERHPCVRVAPTHLMCVIKRFEFDYRLQAIKILEAVDFDAVLHLPLCAPDLSRVVFENDGEKQLVADNAYGLYAVVVHVGTKLEGGHYYCYARDSDSDLTKDDTSETDGTPWTRYDDTKITRTTWKGLKEQMRRSASDTAYILFYRRVDARATQLMNEQLHAPGLNRAVTRLGEIVGSPRAVAGGPNAPAPAAAPAATPLSGPDAAAAAAAGASSSTPPPPHVSASLVELLRRDNTRYLDELQSYTSPHFWQHINASVRAHTRLQGAWSVSAPPSAAGAAGAAAPAAGAGAGADAKVCGICRGPAHGAKGAACVFERFAVVQCPECHMHLTKAQYGKHLVGGVCVTMQSWSHSPAGLTQPEADVDSRPVGGAGAGPGGSSSYSSSSSGGSSNGGSGNGGDAGAGGPPGGAPPPLQRTVSVFTCPTCQAAIAGSSEFAAHLSKTGH